MLSVVLEKTQGVVERHFVSQITRYVMFRVPSLTLSGDNLSRDGRISQSHFLWMARVTRFFRGLNA